MRTWTSLVVGLLAACGGDPAAPDGGVPDGGGGPDALTGCPRWPTDADVSRPVVISHPYTDGGDSSDEWELLRLSTSGDLSATGTTFTMGRATGGEVVFTPDGRIGLVAQEDGTVGAFVVEGNSVTVLEAGFDPGFYASRVVMSGLGAYAWVLDSQWRENGGGVYRIFIECDDTLRYEGLMAPARLPYELLPGPYVDQVVLVAADVYNSAAGNDVHVLDTGEQPGVIRGADAFADDEQIVSAATFTGERSHILVADNNSFSASGNRIAVLSIDRYTLSMEQTITGIEDPYDLVASPFDDAILVVSGFGDAVHVLDFDPQASPPVTYRGEPTYVGGSPQLPGNAVMIDRGSQRGLILLAENTGVRRLRFADGAVVTDLGLTPTGAGLAGIPGALGVAP